MEFYHYLIAVVGGILAGSINTLAGNGSAITLTILTEVLGLPPNVANGSNRIGVFAGSFAAAQTFYRNGKVNWERGKIYIALTTIGAIAGVLVAVWVSNEQFKTVFSYMMVVMLFVVLVKPKKWLRETALTTDPSLWLAVPAFLFLGFYGGFIQMGMGIIFLAVMVLGMKWSLIDSNVIKAVIVTFYTVIVIAIFQWKGLIDWKFGGIIAIGQVIGGWATANFASKNEKANLWAYRLLVVVMILAVLKLFGVFEHLF